MYNQIQPRDISWNRAIGITDDSVTCFLLDWRNGLAFWGCRDNLGQLRFYKCEQEVFNHNFAVMDNQVEVEFDPYDNVIFSRYPTEK